MSRKGRPSPSDPRRRRAPRRLADVWAVAFVVALAVALVLAACARPPAPPPPLFERLPAETTGVAFVNALPEAPDFDILSFLSYYNGGGVAVGDVNNDGRPDLYFTSNLGSNRLYLNRGNYKFEDVTDRAGVADRVGWKSGVTMADVNGDGWVDIYVSGVSYLGIHGRNVLYINDHDGTFTDRTEEYGLAHVGYSTQALFFDYDGDGDLDMYLLVYSTHGERDSERGIGTAGPAGGPHPAADRLFRNDGGHFVDVSEHAGIRDDEDGYGLGVVASDVNGDGCPDLYVANDFQGDDRLYLNGCDGTFRDVIARSTGHTSRFSMGVDAADVNDDGRPDLFVADMLPDREDVLKTSASSESFDLFNMRQRAGYHPQYARNTLQLNRGPFAAALGTTEAGTPRFSEIGYLAGVHATDWSWAPLFADLDNDGRKDLFVTSGIYRRPNDLDYIDFVGATDVQATLARGPTRKQNAAILRRMPQVPLVSHVFRNDGGLRFTDMAAAWGLAEPGFANGAVYVDLTNSGALDLVVSRIDAPAAIYRNRARALNHNAYLTVRLVGSGRNTLGIGAKVTVRADGRTQLLEQMPTRGFESSVDPRLHFGLGHATRVDTLTVVWPDRRVQVLTHVPVDTTLTLVQADASGRWRPPDPPAAPLFEDVTASLGVDYRHAENAFLDTSREPLMPHLLSTEGPALAVGDVNGDGLDDLFVGGAKWQPGHLFLQQRDGTFRPSAQPALAADSLAEDVDAAFFDADGDGHPDLYVVSGGNEFWGDADALRDRLYLNDGRGNLKRATDALPAFFHNGSCVVPGDFDGDGHVDLFVGSRVVSRQYGATPRSYLLRNDGRGHFTDVTAEIAPTLSDAGMVTSAAWVDAAGTGRPDLVVVGEWMPVRVFRQEQSRFVDRTAAAGLGDTEGWWNTVSAADLTGDGRPDLVLGNLGWNTSLRASPSEPVRMYVGDFAHDGSLEQLITFYTHGVSYPLAGRDELVSLIPALRSRFPSYASFGARRVEDLIPATDLRRATVRTARTFASAIAVNDGHGAFTLRPLPVEAQLAPIYASVVDDLDGDGRTDLLVAGNLFGVPPVLGRYDAGYGLLLRGAGDGRFTPVEMAASGVAIEGQVRDMKVLRSAHRGRLIVVARNDDRLVFLRPRSAPKASVMPTREPPS